MTYKQKYQTLRLSIQDSDTENIVFRTYHLPIPEPTYLHYKNPNWCDDIHWVVPNFKAVLYSDYYIKRIHDSED